MSGNEKDEILYIGEIANPELESVTQFSTAGMNKKDGFLIVFNYLEYDVELLSPIFIPRSGTQVMRGFTDEYRGLKVRYPIIARLHPMINIIITVLGSIFTLNKIRDQNYDTIVFYNFEVQYAFPAIIAKFIFKSSLIVEYEDGLSHHSSFHTSLLARAMKFIAPLDGAFLVTSTIEKEISTENTAIVRGVSTVYDPDQEINTASNSKITLELDNQKITVLFSGGLREGKGIETFLDAVASYNNTPSSVQFIICGHGTKRRKQQIRDRVNKMNSSFIEFLGTVDPWTAYLELLYTVDILVALEDPRDIYNQHCFPSKLVEYAMTGKIILTSNISDVKRIKQDPFIIIEEHSGTEVAKTLQRVTGNIEAEKKNAQLSTQKWIAEECSVEAVASKVERVFRRAK